LTLGGDGYYVKDRDYNVIEESRAGSSANCQICSDKIKFTNFIIKSCWSTCSNRQSVMRELKILQKLDHENVIKFYGGVEDWDKDHNLIIFLEHADQTCKENFAWNIM